MRNELPGPGQYEPSNAYVKERVIAHKITKSEREDLISKEVINKPGPGYYESP